jgi:hypothetical protein
VLARCATYNERECLIEVLVESRSCCVGVRVVRKSWVAHVWVVQGNGSNARSVMVAMRPAVKQTGEFRLCTRPCAARRQVEAQSPLGVLPSGHTHARAVRAAHVATAQVGAYIELMMGY